MADLMIIVGFMSLFLLSCIVIRRVFRMIDEL